MMILTYCNFMRVNGNSNYIEHNIIYNTSKIISFVEFSYSGDEFG